MSLTKREEYKKAALAGLCANPGGPFQSNPRSGWDYTNCTTESIAQVIADLADAMIQEDEEFAEKVSG